ncbi:hypothetical protein RvY_02542 [Ramazzottius varieornatus]|uniref:Uncharacterized protein n=1 Tax=Ramazzottius varieornatus TaxID=947166 RepID=A0A1D1UNG7_RAMVA|nr:hypothetical protein RvY_02542 [Ramazzottius varieornatus]
MIHTAAAEDCEKRNDLLESTFNTLFEGKFSCSPDDNLNSRAGDGLLEKVDAIKVEAPIQEWPQRRYENSYQRTHNRPEDRGQAGEPIFAPDTAVLTF